MKQAKTLVYGIGRLLFVVLCLAIFPKPAQAQQATPRFAVAYPYKNSIRIATMQSSGDWRLDDLPDALYGGADADYFTPVWTADGHALYYNALTPDGSNQYRDVRAYDLLHHTSTLIVSLPKKVDGGVDATHINLSPDNRYLWLSRWWTQGSTLVDLQASPDQRVRLEIECDTQVIAWLSHTLIAQEYNTCAPFSIFDIDLSAGKIIKEQPLFDSADNPVPGFDNFMQTRWYAIPATPPYLIGDDGSGSIVRYQPDKGSIAKLFDGQNLLVSDDSKSAMFSADDQLMMLDLATLKASPIQTASSLGTVVHYSQQNNVFSYWRTSPADNPTQIDQIITQKSGTAVQSWYSGGPLQAPCIYVSPDSQRMMLAAPCRDGETIFKLVSPNNKPIWDSASAVAEPRQAFTDPALPQVPGTGWSEKGDWYHFWLMDDVPATPASPVGDGYRPHRTDFAVNAQTGKTIRAPLPGSQYVSASPDGTWWLYAVVDKSDPAKDSVIVYNPTSGASFTLSQGALLPRENYEFQYPIYATWTTVRPEAG